MKKGFINFLGTAGARFVMINQLRSSGGIWLEYGRTKVLIDPGPGSLIRCRKSRLKLDPCRLDAVILTHKHLDHCGDVNVMIEAMTEGGFKKRGVIFAPSDAFGQDGVVYGYLNNYLGKREILRKKKFSVGDIVFEVPIQNDHSVKTFGLKFLLGKRIVSFVSDTRYKPSLIKAYQGSSILVLNVVFYERRPQYEHMCLEDALLMVDKIKPEKAIITHFGMSMIKAGLSKISRRLRTKYQDRVVLAQDGLTFPIND
ncbi:MAG: MBL fold metallo-hydrolase [Candidatus Omnitrophica bacterium]|nr:MBL fold metallo-hydrolase [Candidatus Omnitrophota bacterium]